MDLTPEQIAIGKENFCAAIGRQRREFLEEGIQKKVASGRGLGAHYYGYGESIDAPVKVGVIGTGDEGSVLIGAINPKFVQVVSIADIRPYNIYRAFHGDHYSPSAAAVRPGLIAVYKWESEEQAKENVKVYADYRELIDHAKEDGVEAVIIALPLHLHAKAAIAAMNAGLHVLTEKLMGHSVAQCKEMARVAEDKNVFLVTGHQRHYNILYDNAVELIKEGVLGDLHYIRAQWHRGNLPGSDSWQQPMPKDAKPGDPLANKLNEELASWEKSLAGLRKREQDLKKQGKALSMDDQAKVADLELKIPQKKAQIADEVDAAKYEYKDEKYTDASGKVVYDRPAIEELIRWRLWNRTGGGMMAELGSHQLDAASIFISAVHGGEKQYPLRVHAMAGRPVFPADRDIEDHVYCLFEYAAPGYDPDDPQAKLKTITVAYASINGNGYGGYGETVLGTEGTLVLNREQEALLYQTHQTTKKTNVVDVEEKGTDRKYPKLVVDDKGDPLSAAVGTLGLGEEISRGYTEEIEHWAWCIRNPETDLLPHCRPKVALADAVIALTTNLSAREGTSIEFKPEWFDPHSDETPDGTTPDVSKYA